jgi:hypothetical protein
MSLESVWSGQQNLQTTLKLGAPRLTQELLRAAELSPGNPEIDVHLVRAWRGRIFRKTLRWSERYLRG